MPLTKLLLVSAFAMALSGTAAVTADAHGCRTMRDADASFYRGKKRHAARHHRDRMGYRARGMRPAPVATAAKSPGSCGTFMYWKNGICNDARSKK